MKFSTNESIRIPNRLLNGDVPTFFSLDRAATEDS